MLRLGAGEDGGMREMGEMGEIGKIGKMGEMREMGKMRELSKSLVISVNKLSPPYPYLSNKSVKSVF